MPRSMLRPCSVSRKKPPYAASTWNQQRSRAAIGADGVERIHRAGVGGAGGRDDEPGPEPLGAVGGDRRLEGLGTHAEALVDRDVAHLRLAQSRDPERLLEAVVRLRGQVDHRRRVVGRLAGRGASRAVAIAARLAMLPPDAMLPPAAAG